MSSRICLNLMDHVQWELHGVMKRYYQHGNFLQFALRLDGSVDETRLRNALSKLKVAYPLLTARMRKRFLAFFSSPWEWELDPNNDLPLKVTILAEGSTPESFLEELHLAENDPTEANPIEFHLVRLPNGNNLLAVQWNHALMDGKSIEFLVDELNKLAIEPSESPDSPAETYADEIHAKLKNTPLRKRISRAAAFNHQLAQFVGLPRIRLHNIPIPPKDSWTTQIHSKNISMGSYSQDASAKKLNLTAAIASCCLLAVQELGASEHRSHGIYQIDIPVTQRNFGSRRPICRNMMSRLCIRVRDREIKNLDQLEPLVGERVREQVAGRADLASLGLLRVASFRPRLLRKSLYQFCRDELSLAFSNMGALPTSLQEFLSIPVLQAYSVATICSGGGIMFCANEVGDRLCLTLTSTPELISEELASQFLERVASHFSTIVPRV